jgi:glycosyltransferase involved in cell wall biosynthesis
VNKYVDRIIYRKQKNQGQGSARNAGLQLAVGNYVAFLDADDYWKPTFLERCVAFLKAHPECVAVNTGLITRMHNGTELIQPDLLLNGSDAPTEPFLIDDFFAFWARYDHVRTGSAVIRKSVTDQAGGQRADLRVSQDLEYWGYIATFGKWGYIPEALWFGNSRAAAAAPGWLKKYSQRRKLCPTVESWQKRLLPRLPDAQVLHFKVVRGRVAAGYAHNMMLAGRHKEAMHAIRKFGNEMPKNHVTCLMNIAANFGLFGIAIASGLMQCKEHLKACRIKVGAARR